MAHRQHDVHFRKSSSEGLRDKSPLIVYFLVAAIVAFMFVFGIASVMHGAQGSSSSTASQPSAQAAAKSQEPQSAQTTSTDAERGETQQSQGQSLQAEQKDASNRDADFAVDPTRTDWNFKTNGKKTVYLTIDDGPSALTSQVLDILDRYNAKATFFVVGLDEASYPMIAEAYRRGHTIGLHTYTHDYAQVYSSTDAYFADLDAIGQVVKDQIGFVPCFIRFPGGSSNAISADYSPGIMSALVEEVQARGYQYYDWNLSVGDGSVHTTEEIIGYGTEPVDDENVMLLCHDSSTKQSTVDALPAIIEHYQSLGYSFEAIDRNSWVCHHDVGN